MPRISYVNGRYVQHRDASVHIEDRGYQFADGVYEVLPVFDGRVRHIAEHMERFKRSLNALAIRPPLGFHILSIIMGEVIRRNRIATGVIYLQATRGVAKRNHQFPADCRPSLIVSGWSHLGPQQSIITSGIDVVTRPDERWARPDIKSISLLPNILARQSAKEAGAYEAWLTDAQGFITEGSATNAFIVARDGTVITYPTNNCAILGGVTRSNILLLAKANGISVDERPFSRAEAVAAKEAFVSGTTFMILPVVRIDGEVIGDGTPGQITIKLRNLYRQFREAS